MSLIFEISACNVGVAWDGGVFMYGIALICLMGGVW